MEGGEGWEGEGDKLFSQVVETVTKGFNVYSVVLLGVGKNGEE